MAPVKMLVCSYLASSLALVVGEHTCEMANDVAFVAEYDGNVKFAQVDSAASCCQACQESVHVYPSMNISDCEAWTYDPALTETNCALIQTMEHAYAENRAGAISGTASGTTTVCNNFVRKPDSALESVCVFGTKTECCDGYGAHNYAGICYDPSAGSCCQTDHKHSVCESQETCCVWSGEPFQPLCCGGATPICNNHDEEGHPTSPSCVARSLPWFETV